MQTQDLLKQIRAEMKIRGLYYRDLANYLDVSEVTIKRSFTAADMGFDRILQICDYLDIELSVLLERAESSQGQQIYVLSSDEDAYFYRHREEYAFLVLLCYFGSVKKLQAKFKLKRDVLIKYLSRLARRGFIELLLDDKVRFLKGVSIASKPGSKLSLDVGRKTRAEFMEHSFATEDSYMTMTSLELSPRSATELKKAVDKLDALATKLHIRDEKLGSEQKIQLGLMLAARPWQWSYIKELELLLRST